MNAESEKKNEVNGKVQIKDTKELSVTAPMIPIESHEVCKDGVCELTWKPQRPQAA